MEVKKYIDEDDEPPEKHLTGMEDQVSQGTAFVLGNPEPITKTELLDSIPPKPIVDRLVSQWFNSEDLDHRETVLQCSTWEVIDHPKTSCTLQHFRTREVKLVKTLSQGFVAKLISDDYYNIRNSGKIRLVHLSCAWLTF